MVEKDKGRWPKTVQYGVPGGFCAGVERAVLAYREFIATHDKGTVYSVGEPAHNPYVNKEFIDNGVIFVDSIKDVPQDADVVFGPHGHSKEDETKASLIDLNDPSKTELKSIQRDYMFTECPLVTKVKNEVIKNSNEGYITIYYGQLTDKKDSNGLRIPHPETLAIMSSGNVRLITSKEEALSDDLYEQISNPDKVAFATQTTHNADEALEIGNELKEIFPKLKLPKKEDICFATRNRQLVAKSFNPDVVIIVGDTKTSSNTRSLIKTAEDRGLMVRAVNSSCELSPESFEGINSVGVEASASAPKEAINDVLNFFTSRGSVLEEFRVKDENGNVIDENSIHFKMPKTQSAFIPQNTRFDKNRF